MRNKKYKLLPYEIIEKAADEEPEAVNTVIQNYIDYIKYLSYFQGGYQRRYSRLPQSVPNGSLAQVPL